MAENLKREKKKDDVSLFESLFSFNGYLGRLGLLGTLLLIGSVLTFLLEQNNVFLAFWGYFFISVLLLIKNDVVIQAQTERWLFCFIRYLLFLNPVWIIYGQRT